MRDSFSHLVESRYSEKIAKVIRALKNRNDFYITGIPEKNVLLVCTETKRNVLERYCKILEIYLEYRVSGIIKISEYDMKNPEHRSTFKKVSRWKKENKKVIVGQLSLGF